MITLKSKSGLLAVPLVAVGLLNASPSFAESLFDSLLNSFRASTDAIPFLSSHPVERTELGSKGIGAAQVPGKQTSDSGVLIREMVDPSIVLMQIGITFNGQSTLRETVFAPVDQGHLEKRVYLPHGAGTYTIDMWHSSNPDRYQDPKQMIYLKSYDVTNTDTRDLSFLLPTGDVQSDSPEILSLTREIAANAQNDADKALAIHDWVAGHVAYDSDSYFNGSYASKVFSALETLHTLRSVCQGYSSLYAALARASGLRTKIVNGAVIWPGQTWEQIGTQQAHAWNEVLVDGRWITLDTTWDSGTMNFTTHEFVPALIHKYYDPAPEQFVIDHRKLSVSSEL